MNEGTQAPPIRAPLPHPERNSTPKRAEPPKERPRFGKRPTTEAAGRTRSAEPVQPAEANGTKTTRRAERSPPTRRPALNAPLKHEGVSVNGLV